MKKTSLLCLIVFSIVGSLTAVDLPAAREISVEPVSGSLSTIGPLPSGFAFDCQLGDLNPPAYAVGGFMLPPEEYKLVFDPIATCGDCTVGFDVSAVHVVLQTDDSCTVFMAVDVEEVDYPNSPDCPEPGIEWCRSSQFVVDLPSAGLWDIRIPIECPCLTSDRLYLLSFHVFDVSCAGGSVPDLVTDAFPTLCTNWNNYGTGWYDLLVQYPNWPGNLLFFAEAACCSPPVPVENETWGAIKNLYQK